MKALYLGIVLGENRIISSFISLLQLLLLVANWMGCVNTLQHAKILLVPM